VFADAPQDVIVPKTQIVAGRAWAGVVKVTKHGPHARFNRLIRTDLTGPLRTTHSWKAARF
jgi:hypothetical protein